LPPNIIEKLASANVTAPAATVVPATVAPATVAPATVAPAPVAPAPAPAAPAAPATVSAPAAPATVSAAPAAAPAPATSFSDKYTYSISADGTNYGNFLFQAVVEDLKVGEPKQFPNWFYLKSDKGNLTVKDDGSVAYVDDNDDDIQPFGLYDAPGDGFDDYLIMTYDMNSYLAHENGRVVVKVKNDSDDPAPFVWTIEEFKPAAAAPRRNQSRRRRATRQRKSRRNNRRNRRF